jgi:hypothetical protein
VLHHPVGRRQEDMMTLTLRGFVVAALGVGFTVMSCAFQHDSTEPLAIENEPVRSTMLTAPIAQEGKRFSAVGNDADCVLTTADIHLWCKWITRYY